MCPGRGTHKKQRLSLRRRRGPFVLFLDPSLQAPRPLPSQALHGEFGSGVHGLFGLGVPGLRFSRFWVYLLRASARAEPQHPSQREPPRLQTKPLLWLEGGGVSRVLSLEIRAWLHVHTLCVLLPPTAADRKQPPKALPLSVWRCAGSHILPRGGCAQVNARRNDQ